jgi:hypothetical protein
LTKKATTELLEHLRDTLAEIRSGELEATPAMRHRLEGAVTALAAVLDLLPFPELERLAGD